MRPTFRKLEVKDIGNLERLVADNVEGIEPGLKIVDSRLLLGQAVIDLVGLDARGSLVLIALDFSAVEGLLLRVMDAYSWCLDYPDTIRRLYPMAETSASRPPRVLFIVERAGDAFLRRIKQLSFVEVDCFEFRHLEVNGASIIYFDRVERVRKSVGASPIEATAPAPVAPIVAPAPAPRVEPPVLRIGRPAVVEPVLVTPPVAADPTVQAPVAPTLQAAAAETVQAPLAPPAPVRVPEPVPEPEPQSVKLVGAVHTPVEPPVLMIGRPAVVEPVVQVPLEPPAVPSPALQLEAIESTAAALSAVAPANGNGSQWTPPVPDAVVLASAPALEPGILEAPVAPSPAIAPIVAPEPAELTVTRIEPEPVVQAPASPVWAKPLAQPNGGRPYFFAQASKGTSSETGAAPAAAAPAAPAAPNKIGLEVDDRPELESLSFPKDGLSRQWLEFLSQLGATK